MRLLSSYLEPLERQVERWTIVVDLDGTLAAPPSRYEPLRDGAGPSPRQLIQELTDALVADGWLIHEASTLAVPDYDLLTPSRVVRLVRERSEWAVPWGRAADPDLGLGRSDHHHRHDRERH